MRELDAFAALFIPVFCIGLTWPQAQPKAAASQSPTPQATAPATTPGPCAADYYRNSDGVCVHRPTKTQGSAVPKGATAQCLDG
jgi:hypothetical protein